MCGMKYKFCKRSCVLCGTNKKTKKLFTQRFERLKANYVVSECSSCGFIHQNPAWEQKFYDDFYADLIYDPTNHKFYPAQVKRYKEVADVIAPILSSHNIKKLLDFGCYDGSFIEWLKKFTDWGKRIQLVGYDIHLKKITNKSGFYNSLDLLTKREGKFDAIIFNHVLEHIYNPLETLKFIKNNLLRKNGFIIIEVPDASFLREDDIVPAYIQHINYFTPHTITKLGNKADLSTQYLKTFKNLDIDREPYSPTLLVVFQNDLNYLANGQSLKLAYELNKSKLREKFSKIKKNTSLGIIGCGDALFTVFNFIKQEFKNITVTSLFDNNKNIWNQKMFGIIVQPVEKIKEEKCDLFLICTFNKHNVEQILSQISEYTSPNKIITVLSI